MKQKILFLSAIIFTLALTNCNKDEYGNTTTETSTHTSGNWVYSDPSYYTDISVPEITQGVVDNGAVLVYLVTSGGAGYSLVHFNKAKSFIFSLLRHSITSFI